MRTTTLAGSNLRASRLGFGCAAAGSRYGRRESLNAMARAFELGVNYFDVARAYGYGEAESIVGAFARDKRDRVVIATKFGIDPPPAGGVRTVAKGVARRVFRVLPSLRKAARAQLGQQFERKPIDAARMTASVDRSLRELRTDRIDVFLVHDCPDETLDDDALFDAMDRLVSAGKVLLAGVTGSREVATRAVERRPKLGVAQFRHDVFAPALEPGVRASSSHAVVAYHCLGGETGAARLEATLRRAALDAMAPAGLREKLRALSDHEALSALAIGGVLADDAVDVAVTAMFTPTHIEANARAASTPIFDPADLGFLRGGAG